MISWQLKVTLALFVFVLSALASAIPNGRTMAATAEQHAGTFLRTKSVGEDAPALAEGELLV